jgi:hypothetical protein
MRYAQLKRGPLAHGWDEDQPWTLLRLKILIGRLFHVVTGAEGVEGSAADSGGGIDGRGDLDPPLHDPGGGCR